MEKADRIVPFSSCCRRLLLDIRLAHCPENVAAVFLNFPDTVMDDLLDLRALILATHANTARVGELVEDLRWGQPAYLTEKPVTGSTLRLGCGKSGHVAVFFHCQSRLIETFRSQYEPVFEFEGNRADCKIASKISSGRAGTLHRTSPDL